MGYVNYLQTLKYFTIETRNNKKSFRFEIVFEDEKIAYLQYRWKKGDMLLMSTYVPPEHRGKGIGDQLADAALQHAKDNNLKVQVFCPFIQMYIDKHPEYKDLLSTSI